MENINNELLFKARLEILGNSLDTSKDNLIKIKLNEARALFLIIKYRTSTPPVSEIPQHYVYWQILCAKELYNKNGTEGLSSYSENGIEISYDQALSLISPLLLSLVPPKAGVPK